MGGDDGDAGGRGGGGGDARRSGVATVRDDDVGGGGRDDDDSVSRGGTPAPLSDGSGATPGGGAAGSEASETSERAGTSGTRDETTGDDGGGEGGEGNVRATKTKRGTRAQGRIGRATGARQRGVGTTRPGSGGCCRMASAFPNPADAWATTWARILDLCADVNGAPLVRTPPRRSWGRGPSPLGVAANTGPLVDVSFTASCAAPTGRVPGLRGAFIIASTPCSCVGVGDQHSGIVRLFEVV